MLLCCLIAAGNLQSQTNGNQGTVDISGIPEGGEICDGSILQRVKESAGEC